MKHFAVSFFACVIFNSISIYTAAAQTSVVPSPTPSPLAKATPSLEKDFLKNLVHDQKMIWTSPFRLNKEDVNWLAPMAIVTAVTLGTDSHTSAWVSQNGDLPKVSHAVSWGGRWYITGGTAGAFYVAGRALHNERARETGLLAGQALIDTGIITGVLKVAAGRLRPDQENGTGEFFDGGSSFPSGHSSSVWSVATVIAYEYEDKPVVRYGAYAAATAVALSRYSGRNHFLTDIVVGSAIGFGVGRYVFRTYHQPDGGGVQSKPTTRLMPEIIPWYGGHTGGFGGSFVWRL